MQYEKKNKKTFSSVREERIKIEKQNKEREIFCFVFFIILNFTILLGELYK
jgi:hypothetical protein